MVKIHQDRHHTMFSMESDGIFKMLYSGMNAWKYSCLSWKRIKTLHWKICNCSRFFSLLQESEKMSNFSPKIGQSKTKQNENLLFSIQVMISMHTRESCENKHFCGFFFCEKKSAGMRDMHKTSSNLTQYWENFWIFLFLPVRNKWSFSPSGQPQNLTWTRDLEKGTRKCVIFPP